MLKQQVGKKSGARVLTSLVIAVFLFAMMFSIVQAQDFRPDEDGPLNPRGDVITGTVGMVVAGKGLVLSSTETVSLTVPGSEVKAAYLYWSGVQTINGTDDYTVTLQVDGGVSNEVIAVTVYGPSLWYKFNGPDYYHTTYVAEITNLIELGPHAYTFSDYEINEPLPRSKPYGFAIVAVYEDGDLPQSEITLMDGLDSVFFGFPVPRNGMSSQNCFTFVPDNTESRILDFIVIGSGIEVVTPDVRPNILHYATAIGQPDPADFVQIENPLISSNGGEIDVYESLAHGTSITVPSGHDTACFEMESVDTGSDELRGASFIWQVGAFNLRYEGTTAINLQSITASSSTNILVLTAVGVLLLIVPTAVVVTNRRRKK